MDFVSLMYFCKAAELQHITRASQALNITQPTLSAAIRRLENELNTRLFEQEGRNVRLTQAGHLLLRHARVIFQEVEAVKSDLQRMQEYNNNRVTMVCVPYLLDKAIMREIHKSNPNISINHKTIFDLQSMADIAAGRVDLCVSHPPYRDDNYECRQLMADPLFALFSITHPLAGRKMLHVKDLMHENFIAYPASSLRQEMEQVCRDAGFSPNVVCEMSRACDMLPLLLCSTMVALVPAGSCRELHSDELVMVPVQGVEIEPCLGVAWPKGKPMRPAVRIVRDTLLRVYGREQAAPPPEGGGE